MARWEVPNTWCWAKVSDVGDVFGGGTPRATNPANFSDENGIPWLTPADLSGYSPATIKHGSRWLSDDGYASCGAKILPAGTVLFSSRAPIGYCVIAENAISTNQGFKSVVLPKLMSPKYLRYYLLSSKKYLESIASGSTFKELSGAKMKSVMIPLPPQNEQRRIADKIEALQSKTTTARKALETTKPLLEQSRQSILAAAFRGDLTAQWRDQNKDVEPASELLKRIRVERRARWEEAELAKMQEKGKEPKNDKWKAKYKEPEPLNTERLPELPEGWCWGTATELCEVVVDCHNKTAPYKEKGIPLVRTTNIRNGKINLEETKFVDEPTYHYWSRRCIPLPGDLLFTREAPVGEAGIIPKDVMLCMGQRMMLLRTNEKFFHNKYLLGVLLSPFVLEYAEQQGVGIGVKHLRVRDVEALPVPLPPLQEQQEIARCLDKIIDRFNRIKEIVNQNIITLNLLDNAILKKAFCGELVPQDPDDEPASVLLEKIAAERAELKKASKKTSRKTRKVKKKVDDKSLLKVVNELSTDSFTFDELAAKVNADYEVVKEALFKLLESDSSGLTQIFDKEAEIVKIKKG